MGSELTLPMLAPAADTRDAVSPAEAWSGAGRPSSTPQPAFQRKDAILAAACEQFGRHGFRGASLRDIAREAGVSLTLLNHHFDNKAGLLVAVVAAHRPALRRRVIELERLSCASPRLLQPAELVRTWATSVFEAAASPEGRRFLRLLARMKDDASEEVAAIRGQLEEGVEAFVDALVHCYPAASRRAAASACLCVNASLIGIATDSGFRQDAAEGGPAWMSSCDRARLERFLVAGIDAALSRPEPSAQACERAVDPGGCAGMVHS